MLAEWIGEILTWYGAPLVLVIIGCLYVYLGATRPEPGEWQLRFGWVFNATAICLAVAIKAWRMLGCG